LYANNIDLNQTAW